ncbi:ABC transporter ATP-binding protein [Blastococcus xanthinilyticus]|uniref:Putative ABC transport system ATP-binding protein n=1 Tax=Blastococcus xanthinilyticus TaxID=1564164 RepID=A0A5S5CL53_9ACTN|nr:ABC transporter ATP-binding protein [Blastococcus xanthinilyticus]TYP81908.1 putative ABC transport system ATP-binding protein [Blastococcus xanthinilyticus]
MTAKAPAPVLAAVTAPLPAPAPAIQLRDVTRSFPGPPEVQALKGVSVSIADGEYVSITGPSGSGKSTMLNILGLLDRPTVGEYRLGGLLTGSLGEDERAALRARHLGFVFQAFHLMSRRSVLENVLLPMLYNGTPRAEREPRAREAIERVGLQHRTDFLPGTLSGGERQRVAVARAVASRPRVLLADEPTGNLDQATSAEIMALFEELHADGLTLVVITHDVGVAGRAARQIRLADGRVGEVG